MAEKKRIEWCRYYKGDDSFNEEELKKNWPSDAESEKILHRYYFWESERQYVYGSGTTEESDLVDTYREAGLADYDPRMPIELLAALFACVIHLSAGLSLEDCADEFKSTFFPSYINESV